MRNKLRIFFPGSTNNIVLSQLRERLLRIMLYCSFAVGSVLFALAVIPVLQKGMYPTIFLYSLLYVWTILITFAYGLPYPVRAIGWLVMLFAFGLINLLESGFNVDSGLFLITFIAMSILLMDVPAGLVALLLSSALISSLGFINTNGQVKLPVGLPQSDPLLWIIGGIIFVLMGVLLIYSLTVVVHGLEENLAKANLLADELNKTNGTLQMSETRYRSLVETSPDLVSMLDLDGNIVTSNQGGLALFGYEHQEEAAGKKIVDFISPDDQPRAAEAFQRTLATGGLKNFECQAMRKDGSSFFAEFNAAVIPDGTGQLQGIIIIGRDITIRKESERLLREARDALALEVVETNTRLQRAASRLEELVRHGPVVIYSFRASDHAVTYMSENVAALVGHEASEFLADRNFWRNHVHPDDKERVFAQVDHPGDLDREVFDYRFLKKDGTYCWLRGERMLMRDAQGNPLEFVGSWSDITDRKIAEETLRLSEARYHSLYESMMDPYVQVDLSGRIEQFNQSYQAMLGYEPDELRSLTYMDLTPEKWHEFEAGITENQIWKRGYSDIYEKEYIRKDGTVFPVELRSALMLDEAGKSFKMWAIVRDISERKKAQEALRISEERYRSLYDGMMDAFVSVNMEGWILQCNKAYERMLGYPLEELKKLTYRDLTPRKWHDVETEIVEKQVLPKGYSEIYEKEYIRKDGSVFPIELRTNLIKDNAGIPAGMWAIVRDISERKIVEKTLLESEARYRELLDASMQGVIVFQDMRVVYSNQAITESLGYTQAELNSLTPTEMAMRIHPEDRSMFLERLQKSQENAATSERYSMRVIHKNGEIHLVEARTLPIMLDGKPAMMTTAIDVSEIRRAEAELQESERTQRSILNASDAIVFLADANGVIISANEKFVQRLGIIAESVPGTFVHGIFKEDLTRERRVRYNQVVSSGKPVIFEDSRDGKWFENSFYPVLDEAGKVVRVAAFIRDITEQRRVTEALRASEEKYRTLAEAAHDMIFIVNREDCIEYVNSFGAQFLGWPANKLLGQPRKRYFPLETSQHQEESILQVFQTGEAISSESANTFLDQTVWLNTWLVPLKNAAGEVTSVMGVSRDITTRKKDEGDLRQARDFLEERVAERTTELLDSQEKLRSLTAQTVRTQEEERRLISRELHDDAGQALITLQYSLAAVQNELPETETFSRKRLSESLKIIDQTMQHIRSLAHSLRPPVLDIGGINLSLEEYCREQTERTSIPILYQGQDVPGLPDEVSISLYRFVQEALTNVLRHAQASQVKVRMQYKKGEISISVSDNGRGIEEGNPPGGIGLIGIRERLKLLGGRLVTHSSKGRGTRQVAFVPWERSGSE
ncbi:MAG: PAS domain S-box protein [Anaerolineales bacterium]